MEAQKLTQVSYTVEEANSSHSIYAQTIVEMMFDAAQKRGTGISRRTPEYVIDKMEVGKAIIAMDKGNVIGFCYIETWSHGKYVANSGLIVHEDYRGVGLARKIKQAVFDLSRKQFPNSKIIGLTTSLAVMKINSDLGYRPVTFSELTPDEIFWKGCTSCVNHDILERTQRKHCLCTGMLYDPNFKKPEDKQGGKGLHFWV